MACSGFNPTYLIPQIQYQSPPHLRLQLPLQHRRLSLQLLNPVLQPLRLLLQLLPLLPPLLHLRLQLLQFSSGHGPAAPAAPVAIRL